MLTLEEAIVELDKLKEEVWQLKASLQACDEGRTELFHAKEKAYATLQANEEKWQASVAAASNGASLWAKQVDELWDALSGLVRQVEDTWPHPVA